MFRVKNRDKQPQFFDKHLSKTRKIQFRILMRSDALWYSDHSSSEPDPGGVRNTTAKRDGVFAPELQLRLICILL